MKISELIAALATLLSEHGDIEVMGTEYAGDAHLPIKTVTFQDQDNYGRPVTRAVIVIKERGNA